MFKKRRNAFRKRRAVYLLVACQLDEKTVARELSVKESTVRKWMKQPDFAAELEKAMQRIEGIDAKWRAKQNKILSGRLYEEAHNRIANTRELRDIPLTTLISKIREVNNEIRVDTPGDATSRGEMTHKHELQDALLERYKEAQKQQPRLSLVEMPSGDEPKKEGTNE
ncbi:MAG: hypothetical protein ACTSW7_01080 [Candidatus Thorarchaeota archaeon]|nr:MAG: hypothetical protein DRQ25_04895 [Candidatus Fermentibacteria bacterium]HEC72032.1 hypothetical protein [Thermoplasmatales archaeon]